MKSPVAFLTLLTFFAFDFLTGAYAGLPKWGTLIAGPPPPALPREPFTVLPPAESSPSLPVMQFTQAPEVTAAASADPVFAAELTQSPEPSEPVSSVELSESPQVSAAPGAPTSSRPLPGDRTHLDSPCASLKPTPSISATPVSVLELLDAISMPPLRDEHVQLPAESEIPLVTPAPTPESLALSQPNPETPTHTRDDVADKRACFPSNAIVTLRSGTRIPIARLRVGDLVESEPGHFSPVLMHTHADTQANTTFVVLRTRRGSQIAASPGHYLITADGRLRLAHHFRVHDQVRTANSEEYVVSVGHAIYRGLHNPQTASGKLLAALDTEARAVQASTYTTAVLPNAAHAALSPLRALHTALGLTFPALSACVCSIAESPLSHRSHNDDDHTNRIADIFPWSINIGINVYLAFYVRFFQRSALTAKK